MERPKTGEIYSTWRKLSRCHFVHKNTTLDGLESKLGFRGKMPSTNGLRHGVVIEFQLSRLYAVTYMSTDLGNRNTNFAIN